MTRQIIFIQGGGDDGYGADIALVSSLRETLGDDYDINYPKFESDDSVPDFGWIQQIEDLILRTQDDVLLVAHSLGASMLLKYLSERSVAENIRGVFLVSTPFWRGNEDWKKGLKLQKHFSQKLPYEVPLFFYHCKDDEVAPFCDLDQYKQEVTRATFRELNTGGHQLSNDLRVVAQDIKSLNSMSEI